MRSEIKVTPEQLGTAGANAADAFLARLREAAYRATRAAARASVTEVIKEIHATKPYAPIDQGWMNDPERGWNIEDLAKGSALESTAPHAPFIEFGTKPHWAPLPALEAWASRKLRAKFSPKNRVDAAKAMARKVQFKIARYGTEGRFFFTRASQRFPAVMSAALEAELALLAKGGQ